MLQVVFQVDECTSKPRQLKRLERVALPNAAEPNLTLKTKK
jgi:hypothetical protein